MLFCRRQSISTNHLNYVASAFNKIVHPSTGFTPEFLHHGRHLPSNLSALLGNPSEEATQSYGEFAEKLIQRLLQAYILTLQCLQRKAIASKRYYEKHVKEKRFSVRDRVLMHCPKVRHNAYPKWERLYAQECEVLERVNDIIYILQTVGPKKRRIMSHVDKLRLLPRDGEKAINDGH
jgi:hypothetical protein